MENLIEIKNEYNSLDVLNNSLKKRTSFESSITYDIWEHRTDAKGQMEQCIVLKKSNMHAVKLYFIKENTIKVNYIIPNKMMNAFFGKSVKSRRNIIEMVTGIIKQSLLASSQKKAFEELEKEVKKVAS